MWKYLSEYAGVASMPKSEMFYLEELLLSARSAHTDWVRQREWHRCACHTTVIVGYIHIPFDAP